jgi:hypothetical protein
VTEFCERAGVYCFFRVSRFEALKLAKNDARPDLVLLLKQTTYPRPTEGKKGCTIILFSFANSIIHELKKMKTSIIALLLRQIQIQPHSPIVMLLPLLQLHQEPLLTLPAIKEPFLDRTAIHLQSCQPQESPQWQAQA